MWFLSKKTLQRLLLSQVLDIPESVGESKAVRIALICPDEFAGDKIYIGKG